MTIKMKLVPQTGRYICTGPINELIKAGEIVNAMVEGRHGKQAAHLILTSAQARRVAKKMAFISV
jgi:hypothetical protein